MPSPFDDLLKEFDEPLGGPEDKPPEDPLRGENLELLMKLSKKIEGVAATLDPSGPKHPLHNQQLPEEARLRLKNVINGLMDVQGELHEIEKDLLEEIDPKEAPPEPSPDAPLPRSMRGTDSKKESFKEELSSPEEKPIPVSLSEDAPPSVPVPPPEPISITPSPDLVLLEKEKHDFDTYKAKWEHVFTEDPAQRLAHPEVAAYYTQMEAYFHEKEAYLKQNSGT